MHVVIAKINEVLFEGEAQSLTVPGAEGEMTVLANHEPLVTTLRPGRIVVRVGSEESEKEFTVIGGILEVNPAGATVML
jgi:F-type H+-transporting ATPase subunit epsilon